MARLFFIALLFPCLLTAYVFFHGQTWEQREDLLRTAEASYVIPSRFSRVLALEHKGLLSNYLFLKTATFYGDRVMYQQELNDEDWRYIIASLETITDLDPYFLDPYVLAEGLLPWEAGEVEEANKLLEKARQYRSGDWQIPFFIGFNYFYFLKDYEKGADYLMEAAKLPGSPSFLPTLAARLGYYGGKTKTAIIFLKGLLVQTTDPRLRSTLEKRLLALERAAMLEELVEKYQQEHGARPEKITELVSKGYIDALPEDPYGGEWVILKSGRVFSTSKFISAIGKGTSQ